MKRMGVVILAAILVAAGTAQALPPRVIAGAAVGTAVGLVIAHNVGGVNPWVAGTVGALVGGTLAEHRERRGEYWYAHPPYWGQAWDHDRYWRGDRHGQRYGPWARTWYGDPGCYRGYDYDPPPPVVYVPQPQKAVPRPAPPPDLQPGVDLIKISILNSNGIRTDIPVLRVNGKFVGPQGEEYATLPTAETLAGKYGM